MTILVDDAIWPWRGERWAHLVSDSSLDELHRFATGIGKRRVSFQGDHYDVDRAERDAALAAGAVAVDCREVVRALRRAGLRRRPGDPAVDWRWHQRFTLAGPHELGDALQAVHHHPHGRHLSTVTCTAVDDAGLAAGPVGLVTLIGSRDLAVVVTAPERAWGAVPRVDELAVHEAYTSRRDGALTLELLSGPGTAR